MTGPLLTDAVRAWIGAEASYTAPDPLGRASIRYFARAVRDDNPIYTDDSAARDAGYREAIAPPTLVVDTNQYMAGRRDAHGYGGHTWDLPIEGCRVIRGGHRYEFGRAVVAGDVLTARWRLTDIQEKRSRTGRSMLIVTSVVEISDERSELLARNTETLIYERLGGDQGD